MTREKTICLFNSNRVWGGGEKWHYLTARELKKENYKVLLITNRKSDLYHAALKENIQVHALSVKNLSFLNPIKILYLVSLFRKFKVDTLILGLSSDVKLGGIAGKIAGVRKVIYRRGSAIPVKKSLINHFIFRYILHLIIANSREIKDALLKNNHHIITANKIKIIYNGIDPSFFRNGQKTGKTNEDPVILGNAGRFVEQKGQVYLIEMARILKSEGCSFRLLITGKGKLKKHLLKKIKQYQLEEEIQLTDFSDNIHDFLKCIDIFVFPSLHEGSANIILEAMAMSKPVVAFDTSSIPELIKDKETGFLVPFKEVNDFASKVKFLIENPTMRYKMGIKSRERIQRNFQWNEKFNELLQVINK